MIVNMPTEQEMVEAQQAAAELAAAGQKQF